MPPCHEDQVGSVCRILWAGAHRMPPSGLSPDAVASSPMSAFPGASRTPLLMRSNTFPARMDSPHSVILRGQFSAAGRRLSGPLVLQQAVIRHCKQLWPSRLTCRDPVERDDGAKGREDVARHGEHGACLAW